MKKISVIIPVHNTEKYLDSCLKSVLNQTEESMEVIAVNDHSTDHSLQILKNYEKLYSYKMKVIDMQEKYGVSCARNEGLKMAGGKYIGFVDSDDFVSLNMFRDFCEALEQYHLPVAIGNSYRVSSTKILNDFYVSEKEIPKMKDYDKYGKLVKRESPAVWDKVFLHDFIEGYFFLENHIYEDIGFTYPLLLKAKEVLEYYRSDYAYRYTPGSIMNSVDCIKPNILDIVSVCNHAMQIAKTWNLEEEKLEVLHEIFASSIVRRACDIERWNLTEKEKVIYLHQMLAIGNFYFPKIREIYKDEIFEIPKEQISFQEENFKRRIRKKASIKK